MATETAISTGALLRELILSSPEVTAITTNIFPCVAFEDTLLPYIQYQCAGLDVTATKPGGDVDKVLYDVAIFTEDFDQGATLAEAVRAAVSHRKVTDGALFVSNVRIINFTTHWAGDAYAHVLRVQISTNTLNPN